MMWWIVIGVAAVVLLAVAWVYVRYILVKRQLQQLDTRVEALDDGSVVELIRTLDHLNLSGESLKTLTKWEREYQQLSEGQLVTLQTQLIDAEQQVRQVHIGAAKQQLATVETGLTSTEHALADVVTNLQSLKERETDNRTRLVAAREAYQEARKTVLAKSFSYGDAQPALEERLQAIEADLKTVSETNQSGDHEQARGQLDKLKLDVASLQLAVKQLPAQVNLVVNEFPGQLDELEQSSGQLLAQNYQFAEDPKAKVLALRQQLSESEAAIKNLEVTELSVNNEALAEEIEALYAMLEGEMVAKKQVQQDRGDLRRFIAHAAKQNHLLLIDLDHLNQSYTLNHDEIATAHKLLDQLDQLTAAFTASEAAIDQHEAVYSQLAAQYQDTREQLTAIETKQREINQAVSDLRAHEKRATAQADQFEMALRDIKYEMNRQNLPGLPRPYLEFYHVVEKELAELNQQLNLIQIDLDQIAKQLIKVQQDIDKLKDQSQAVLDTAALTELLMQYANRYKVNHKPVADAVTQADKLYNQYLYQDAADTVAAALESVEPGAYQKVEDDYMAQRKASLF